MLMVRRVLALSVALVAATHLPRQIYKISRSGCTNTIQPSPHALKLLDRSVVSACFFHDSADFALRIAIYFSF